MSQDTITILNMGTEQSLEVHMGDKTRLVNCTTLDVRQRQLYADVMTRPKLLGSLALLKELKIKICSSAPINTLNVSSCGKFIFYGNVNSDIKVSEGCSAYVSQNVNGNIQTTTGSITAKQIYGIVSSESGMVQVQSVTGQVSTKTGTINILDNLKGKAINKRKNLDNGDDPDFRDPSKKKIGRPPKTGRKKKSKKSKKERELEKESDSEKEETEQKIEPRVTRGIKKARHAIAEEKSEKKDTILNGEKDQKSASSLASIHAKEIKTTEMKTMETMEMGFASMDDIINSMETEELSFAPFSSVSPSSSSASSDSPSSPSSVSSTDDITASHLQPLSPFSTDTTLPLPMDFDTTHAPWNITPP